MTYNSGLVQSDVTLTTSSGIALPSAGQTLINQVGTGNAGSQNAYTVPAGKTFYLFGVIASTTTAQFCNIFKNDATTYVQAQNASSVNGVFPIPIATYTENQIVKITATAGVIYNVVGVLI